MGQLYIPGRKKINGPWLLNSHDLEELDEVFEFIGKKINESSELEVEDSAQTDVDKGLYPNIDVAISKKKEHIKRHYPDIETKRVILYSTDEKRLIDSSLRGILRDPKLKDFTPKELNLDVESSNTNQFSLNIRRRFDGEITYKVKCFDQNCEEEIIYKIETWLEKHQPNIPKRIWNHFAGWFGLISLLLLIAAASSMETTELPNFKADYKNQITKIIETGINENNEKQSIELLLKYMTDYRPKDIKEVKKINKTWVQIFYISIFILAVAIFNPKTTIGIGKHKPLLKLYDFYISLVLVTLPAIFILPPLIDWIKNITGLN